MSREGLMKPGFQVWSAIRRAGAFLLACALIISLASSVAWAQDSDDEVVGQATLTLVNGVSYGGPVAEVNVTYDFTEGATVEDLFEAAREAGDILDYEFVDSGYGSYLESVTLVDGTVLDNDPSYVSYWSCYKNATYAGFDADDWDATQATDVLSDGDALQFAWVDSVAQCDPSTDQWNDLSGEAILGDTVAQGAVAIEPSPSTEKVDVSDLASSLSSMLSALYTNLSALCVGSGGESSTNALNWLAMDAAAIGQASVVDMDAVLEEALSAYNSLMSGSSYDGTSVQRSIIVLTALGIDATQVETEQGTLNLVELVATSSNAVTSYPTSIAFTLLAYACGSYDVAADAENSVRELIDSLVADQSSDGGYLTMGLIDVDTTAMVISALAAYQGDDAASQALDAAVSALRAAQSDDGTFGNVNSTAMAVMAFCAVGIDPASEEEWADSALTPLAALLSFAQSDLEGFVTDTGYVSDLVNEQAFRALISYQGLVSTGSAYNIYLQAQQGEAFLTFEVESGSDESDRSDALDSSDTLVQTGDNTHLLGGVLFASALCSLACGAFFASRIFTDKSAC